VPSGRKHSGHPDLQGDDGEHAGFCRGCHTRYDQEEHAQAGGDVARAGEVSPEDAKWNPRRDQVDGFFDIDEMREPDRNEPDSKEIFCETDAAVAGCKLECRTRGKRREAGKQDPPTRQKHCEFAEAEPHAFDLRSDYQGRHLEECPDDEIGKKNAHGPCGRGAEQQSGAAHQHQYAGAVSQRRASGYPWGIGLPDHCEIAVDERENAEANHSYGEQGRRRLKA
jgi:hypothetical protein